MIEEKLKFLGLTEYEIKAYLTLVKKGKLKAYEIVKEANISSGKIYETLNNLEQKGLITIIPDKVNYYYPKPVEVIIQLIKKKEKELKELEKELKELKTVEENRETQVIQVVTGKKNFHRLMISSEKKSTKTFNYAIKWNADIVDMNIQKSVKKMKDNNADLKVLYDYDTPKKNIEKWKKLTPKHKFIRADKVAISIDDNKVMISLVKNNSTILIRSKEFIEVMKQLFEGYYSFK